MPELRFQVYCRTTISDLRLTGRLSAVSEIRVWVSERTQAKHEGY